MKHSLTPAAILITFLSACTSTNTYNDDLARSEKSAISRAELGVAYMAHGEIIKARENLLKAYNIDPTNLFVLLALAQYYEQVNELESANKIYSQAVQRFPKNGYVLNNYGTYLCTQNQYLKAQNYFKAATNSSYLHVAASYENYGLCMLKSGEKQLAYKNFSRALGYEPNRYVSLIQLCRIDVEMKNYAKAEARLTNFHSVYGYRRESTKLLIKIAKLQNNRQLENRYTLLFNQL
ncbi:type IV pilus biogenesis/stability protein PilW [Vibrio marisflavi]|uniref:Beta-barrel assembly-enhancing protease n=1 Tax=Vibrio marisflavi CECT 7928 TaxID=634439 RepID=A0ABN8E6Z5_9VIBR|nr:type IV pilus biogenesis/stability protein PilW [Vibrio marisflavi]CAH0539696.1 Beta-barrel assembly-enhancing protease [Vibrio marisflavi CECT 7928]